MIKIGCNVRVSSKKDVYDTKNVGMIQALSRGDIL
jgi:hypothetical protein